MVIIESLIKVARSTTSFKGKSLPTSKLALFGAIVMMSMWVWRWRGLKDSGVEAESLPSPLGSPEQAERVKVSAYGGPLYDVGGGLL
jgi:hypothetical protein